MEREAPVSKTRKDPPPGFAADKARERPQFPSARVTRAATLAGVAALVAFSGLTWREVRQIRSGLDGRLAEIDGQIAKLGSRVSQPAAAAQRGPDPNRVYTIKTEGAPARGPADAPVTIAEFSDFQ
jgi:protein-disulfide isomerase